MIHKIINQFLFFSAVAVNAVLGFPPIFYSEPKWKLQAKFTPIKEKMFYPTKNKCRQCPK